MNLVAKSVATLASAALLSAGAAGVADAHPAPHRASHPASHSTSHSASHHGVHARHHGKPVDKLAGPRKAATQAISAQYRSVQRLVTAAATFTGAHAADLGTALSADLAAIGADRTSVAGATSVKALNALKAAALGSRQVAGTQFSTVQSVDGLAAQEPGLTTQIADLQSQLDALAAGGTDVTAAQAALDAIQQSLTSASGELDGLAAQALALLPTAAKTQVHTTADAVAAALPGLSDALAGVTSNLGAFSATYGL